jgi:hypothetical protein
MAKLYLQDAASGVTLGTQEVEKIPTPGASWSFLADGKLIPLEVLSVVRERVNEGGLFADYVYWVKCQVNDAN